MSGGATNHRRLNPIIQRGHLISRSWRQPNPQPVATPAAPTQPAAQVMMFGVINERRLIQWQAGKNSTFLARRFAWLQQASFVRPHPFRLSNRL